jgi:hypothetical protein
LPSPSLASQANNAPTIYGSNTPLSQTLHGFFPSPPPPPTDTVADGIYIPVVQEDDPDIDISSGILAKVDELDLVGFHTFLQPMTPN